jgi:hypothetical protein
MKNQSWFFPYLMVKSKQITKSPTTRTLPTWSYQSQSLLVWPPDRQNMDTAVRMMRPGWDQRRSRFVSPKESPAKQLLSMYT